MSEPIEVNIRVSDYPDNWDMTPSSWELWIVGKLKDAGVPVEGSLVFRGIKSGVLSRFDDPKDFGGVKYVWTPPHTESEE